MESERLLDQLARLVVEDIREHAEHRRRRAAIGAVLENLKPLGVSSKDVAIFLGEQLGFSSGKDIYRAANRLRKIVSRANGAVTGGHSRLVDSDGSVLAGLFVKEDLKMERLKKRSIVEEFEPVEQPTRTEAAPKGKRQAQVERQTAKADCPNDAGDCGGDDASED